MKLTHIPYDKLGREDRAMIDEIVESNRERVVWFRRVLGGPQGAWCLRNTHTGNTQRVG